MSARTERRGFTLLELMVASAVGLIILVAAMAAFDLQASFSRNTERLLGAHASSGLGLTMMQRDLENAGLRFRGGVQVDGGVNWAAVVRPYDQLGTNIVDLCNDTTCGTKVSAPSGFTGGYIAGSDAFEVLLGSRQMDARRVGAQVGSSGAFGGSTTTVTISPDPFTAAELAATGASAPLLMFWNDDIHCIGRMTAGSTSAGVATVTVSTVDAKFGNSGTAWKPGCPAALMNVDILQYRHRYLVYQGTYTSSRPARVGLHLQSNPFCDPLDGGTVCSTDLDPQPMMIAEGVDDMQVAWRVPDGWGPDGGVWCQKSTAESCDFEQLNTSDGQRAAAIIGAQIYLSSHGPEIYRRDNEQVPILFNHTPSPATDGVVRSVMQASVLFRNAVTP